MTLALSADRLQRALSPIHPCGPDAAARIATWSEVLSSWSRVQRLVGWRSGAALLREGVADAWAMVPLVGATRGALLDVGSGNGLPGLVLAAAMPERPVHLVEVQRKRAAFLREAARRAGLSAVVVHHGSADAVRVAGAAPVGAVFLARAFKPPLELLAEAALWGAGTCIVSTGSPGPTVPGWELVEQRPGEPADRRIHIRYDPAPIG